MAVFLLYRFGKRYAIGANNGSAFYVGVFLNGVIVAWKRLQALRVNNLYVGKVGDKQGKKHTARAQQMHEPAPERNTTQHARFGCVERKVCANMRVVSKFTVNEFAAKAFEHALTLVSHIDLCASACAFVARFKEQTNGNKACEKRRAALAHKRQRNAGKR